MEVKKNSVTQMKFIYDGDGRRVKSEAYTNGVLTETILFIGAHYEVKGNEITKYYFAGTTRVAMRKYIVPQTTTLTYLIGDHLGSTSLAVDATTGAVTETRYKAWGEVRYTTPNKTLPTRFTFTSQYSYVADDATDLGSAGFGLMFYQSRFYDPSLGRFTQADSIVPNPFNSQDWDRYSYVQNSPLKYTDPTGHDAKCSIQCQPLDVLNMGKLSKRGKDLYRTYIKMWNNADGWWWTTYGGDGAFTIDEFMAINWHYEQANFGNLDEYNAAVKNAAASWSAHACKNATFSCDLSSAEGSLNFLGYYSQSAQGRANKCGSKPCDIEKVFNYTEWDKESASTLVAGIHGMSPTTEFETGDWFSVGNVSMNEEVYRKMMRKGWVGKVVGGNDPMIILTYCQATFAWWAIAQGNKNHSRPSSYINARNYAGFCG